MKLLLFSVLLFASSTVLSATYTINTKIKKVRTVTELNPVTAARSHVPFQVVEKLAGNCTWLYLTGEAKNEYSLLLAAKISGQAIGIQYSDTPSPWHAGTCQVHHLDLD